MRTVGIISGVARRALRAGQMVAVSDLYPLDYLKGGGMVCPKCGVRGLVMLDEERGPGQPTRMQCGNPKCCVGVNMRVRGGGISLEVAR